jgi:hypothetical protein
MLVLATRGGQERQRGEDGRNAPHPNHRGQVLKTFVLPISMYLDRLRVAPAPLGSCGVLSPTPHAYVLFTPPYPALNQNPAYLYILVLVVAIVTHNNPPIFAAGSGFESRKSRGRLARTAVTSPPLRFLFVYV